MRQLADLRLLPLLGLLLSAPSLPSQSSGKVEDLKDESEPYRRMVMETITKVIEKLGTADVDAMLEELLIDGILYAFQEQTADDGDVMLT